VRELCVDDDREVWCGISSGKESGFRWNGKRAVLKERAGERRLTLDKYADDSPEERVWM